MRAKRKVTGYSCHTPRTQRLVVRAQLRHYWDTLRMLRYLLRSIENAGGPGRMDMLPGEHYRLAALAVRVSEKALARSSAPLWDDPDPLADERSAFVAAAKMAPVVEEMPHWHVRAEAAIDEARACEPFRVRASEKSIYDRAAERERDEGADE